jgi:hypothetical protein
MHDHACGPLYPTFSHNATWIPPCLPLSRYRTSISANRPRPLGNGLRTRRNPPCTPRCSRPDWARACRFGAIPSDPRGMLGREVVALRGVGSLRLAAPHGRRAAGAFAGAAGWFGRACGELSAPACASPRPRRARGRSQRARVLGLGVRWTLRPRTCVGPLRPLTCVGPLRPRACAEPLRPWTYAGPLLSQRAASPRPRRVVDPFGPGVPRVRLGGATASDRSRPALPKSRILGGVPRDQARGARDRAGRGFESRGSSRRRGSLRAQTSTGPSERRDREIWVITPHSPSSGRRTRIQCHIRVTIPHSRPAWGRVRGYDPPRPAGLGRFVDIARNLDPHPRGRVRRRLRIRGGLLRPQVKVTPLDQPADPRCTQLIG